MENIQELIILPHDELEKFSSFIKENRNNIITKPIQTAKNAYENNKQELIELIKQKKISKFIFQLREYCYKEFLKEEAEFNKKILSTLGEHFYVPNNLILKLCKKLFDIKYINFDSFTIEIQKTIGEYIGHITPYVYQLFLSNTQSRRSRAGKTFEGIIYFLYEYLGYSYDSQTKIGRRMFANLGLGKIVDSILPNIKSFNERRNKTIVGSMKTTLRERWQEVVEELQRSNIPNIHLLTVDDDISNKKIEQISMHNIVLVVLESVKNKPQCFNNRAVISFEEYFLKEIPICLQYWRGE